MAGDSCGINAADSSWQPSRTCKRTVKLNDIVWNFIMMPAGSRTRFNETYFICNTYFDY